jgi:hypothetical protein
MIFFLRDSSYITQGVEDSYVVLLHDLHMNRIIKAFYDATQTHMF